MDFDCAHYTCTGNLMWLRQLFSVVTSQGEEKGKGWTWLYSVWSTVWAAQTSSERWPHYTTSVIYCSERKRLNLIIQCLKHSMSCSDFVGTLTTLYNQCNLLFIFVVPGILSGTCSFLWLPLEFGSKETVRIGMELEYIYIYIYAHVFCVRKVKQRITIKVWG